MFHTDDGGKTWSVSKTPLRRDSANAGIFALAFADSRHGIAMGGDYARPADATGNIALTGDTGKTWEAPSSPPSGYRSAVAYLAYRNAWVATGPSGSGISVDGGKTWERFDQASYNAMSFVSGAGWAVGPEGAVAKFH